MSEDFDPFYELIMCDEMARIGGGHVLGQGRYSRTRVPATLSCCRLLNNCLCVCLFSQRHEFRCHQQHGTAADSEIRQRLLEESRCERCHSRPQAHLFGNQRAVRWQACSRCARHRLSFFFLCRFVRTYFAVSLSLCVVMLRTLKRLPFVMATITSSMARRSGSPAVIWPTTLRRSCARARRASEASRYCSSNAIDQVVKNLIFVSVFHRHHQFAHLTGVSVRKMKTQFDTSHSTTFVTLEDVRVPAKNLIGSENEGIPKKKKKKTSRFVVATLTAGVGFMIILTNFNHERFVICAGACRQARVCFEEAFEYAMQRKTFGKRLVDHQVRLRFEAFQAIDVLMCTSSGRVSKRSFERSWPIWRVKSKRCTTTLRRRVIIIIIIFCML